jgi:hypothetical protein
VSPLRPATLSRRRLCHALCLLQQCSQCSVCIISALLQKLLQQLILTLRWQGPGRKRCTKQHCQRLRRTDLL